MQTKSTVTCINCGTEGELSQMVMSDETWKYRHSSFKCTECGRLMEQTTTEVFGESN